MPMGRPKEGKIWEAVDTSITRVLRNEKNGEAFIIRHPTIVETDL
jgi:hypothetical protein